MLLKGKIKLKVWGWLLKKDQVSEDNKHGKLSETVLVVDVPTIGLTDLSSTRDYEFVTLMGY